MSCQEAADLPSGPVSICTHIGDLRAACRFAGSLPTCVQIANLRADPQRARTRDQNLLRSGHQQVCQPVAAEQATYFIVSPRMDRPVETGKSAEGLTSAGRNACSGDRVSANGPHTGSEFSRPGIPISLPAGRRPPAQRTPLNIGELDRPAGIRRFAEGLTAAGRNASPCLFS
jgi:hypothetical protein